VNAGVYSDAQAARGEKTFGDKCGMCHELTRFTGDEFTRAWSGQPLKALYTVMRTSMPEDNPGNLPAQDYADVLAFFLKTNKYPAGAGELKGTDEAMAAVLMESPKP
jgi:mono/diheme cytochrome c family protein